MADQTDQNSNDSQPEKKTDGKKSKKLNTSSTKGDAIDKGKTLVGRTELNPSGRPDAINMNPVYTHVNNSFEASFGDELNELNAQQRLKKAMNFRRIQGKIQLAKKKSMLRKGSGKVIAKRAKVLAINMIKMKLAGNRKISDLSPMEKQRVEKLVGNKSATVDKLALRLIPAVKKKEAKRFIKKESIDVDNVVETVQYINEIINSSAGGGVRGMGYVSGGGGDGDSPNYTSNNVDAAGELLNYINQLMQDHQDMHYSDGQHDENIAPDSDTKDNIMKGTKGGAKAATGKVTKEDIHDNPDLRLDTGTPRVLLSKNDTPGEPKFSLSAIRKSAPKVKKMPKVDEEFESFFEGEDREAIPRSGQPRKSIDNVVRNSVCRCMSTNRQQAIQKKIIDEAKMGNPCWKGYKAYGMKKKNGKTVPNCVPVKENAEYKGEHEAPTNDGYNKPMHDLKGIYPDDFHGPNGFKHYSDFGNSYDHEAHHIATSAKDRPGKMVRVYRSIPKDAPKKVINKGDWVATTKQYARDHGDAVHGEGNHKIISKAVHARSLFTDGNSIHEWGYDPQPYSPKKVDEEFEMLDEVAAWQRKEGKNEKGGLNQKGVDSYRADHPGSHLQTAVTKKPSELKAGSKAANRRKSFCARMSGMKKHNTSAETAHDPDSRINKSLRKWNC